MKKILIGFAAVVFATIVYAESKPMVKVGLDDKVQLKSRPEFTQDGAWTIGLTPIYSDLTKVYDNTDEFGRTYTTYTFKPEIAKYEVYKKLLDTINGYTKNACYASEPYVISSDTEKEVIVTLYDSEDGTALTADNNIVVSKAIGFKMYSIDDKVTYYTADTTSYINELYTEWYGYVAKRSTNTVAEADHITGYNTCDAVCAKNDYLWSDQVFRYYAGTSYNSNLYIPVKNVAFRGFDTVFAIKNSVSAIGPHVALSSVLAQGITISQVGTDSSANKTKFIDTDGTITTIAQKKTVNLEDWAINKNSYNEEEIKAIKGVLVVTYDDEIPANCQASILKATKDGDGAPGLTNCVNLVNTPGFSLTQHGTVVPEYIANACVYGTNLVSVGGTLSNDNYRKDGTGIDVIANYHYGHAGDIGNSVIFWIYNGESILVGNYLTATTCNSYGMGWRIIRDFCKENSLVFNLYDIVNKKKTAVDPTL